ncbi:hypothetical protein BJX65DRAFT_209130 [Aspergillus insuetus]
MESLLRAKSAPWDSHVWSILVGGFSRLSRLGLHGTTLMALASWVAKARMCRARRSDLKAREACRLPSVFFQRSGGGSPWGMSLPLGVGSPIAPSNSMRRWSSLEVIIIFSTSTHPTESESP